VPAHGLSHLGRLSALKSLALFGLPNATNDEGMQQLAPQLHARLSGLEFNGVLKSEVCTVPSCGPGSVPTCECKS
jgi:hypothetical protein